MTNEELDHVESLARRAGVPDGEGGTESAFGAATSPEWVLRAIREIRSLRAQEKSSAVLAALLKRWTRAPRRGTLEFANLMRDTHDALR